MGTRVIYQVQDSDGSLICTLYSNSSHAKQSAEEVFLKTTLFDAECQMGPNALAEKLLTARYQTASGNHQAGDRIFWLVAASEATDGDREKVITASHGIKDQRGFWQVANPNGFSKDKDMSTTSTAISAEIDRLIALGLSKAQAREAAIDTFALKWSMFRDEVEDTFVAAGF